MSRRSQGPGFHRRALRSPISSPFISQENVALSPSGITADLTSSGRTAQYFCYNARDDGCGSRQSTAPPSRSRDRDTLENSTSYYDTEGTNHQVSPRASSQAELYSTSSVAGNRLPGSAMSRTPAAIPSRRKSRTTSRNTSYIGDGENVICALSESRGGVPPSIGIALINRATGEVILSQICDNQSFVKTTHTIRIYEPSRVLLVSKACPPNPKSTLYRVIEENCPSVSLVAVDRKYWTTETGLMYVDKLASPEDAVTVKVAIQSNFYATCSLAAVC